MINLDKEQKKKNIKRGTCKSVYALYEAPKLTFNTFKSRIFPLKPSQGKGSEILTPNQILQILPIALVQVILENLGKFTKWNTLNNIFFV